MPKGTEPKKIKQKDVFSLAYVLSDRVELDNVILTHCQAERAPELGALENQQPVTSVSQIAYSIDDDSNKLHVMVSFVLRLADRDQDEADPPLRIRASFVLFYAVTNFDEVTPEHIEAFGATNAMLNVWPYWREFVHATTARMGLANPVLVPVFRVWKQGSAEEKAKGMP